MTKTTIAKKVITLLVCALFIFTVGCSGTKEVPKQESKPAADSKEETKQEVKEEVKAVDLTWSMWVGSSEELGQWQQLADDAVKENPSIKSIKLETTDFLGYWPKLETQFAAKSTADIVAMQSIRAQTYLSKGGMQPLTPFIKEDKDVNVEDFNPIIREAMSYNGDLYAFGYDAGPYVIFYNKQLFDKYGVSYPDEDFTWEELIETGKKITKDGNYMGTTNNTIDHAMPWIWAAGGHYYDEANKKYNIYQPGSVEGLQFLADLYTKHKIYKPIADPGNSNWHREQFYTGTIGMIIDGPWFLTNAKKNCKFEFGLTAVPVGPKGRAAQIAGSGFGIGASTKNPKEAYLAVKSITSTKSLTKIAEWGRGVPARQSAVPGFYKAWEGIDGLDIVAKSAQRDGRVFAGPANWVQVTELFRNTADSVYLGSIDADKALSELQSKIEKLN